MIMIENASASSVHLSLHMHAFLETRLPDARANKEVTSFILKVELTTVL